MGLFGKKEPCAICGGKVKGFLPWKIDGQLICDDCHGTVDLPDGIENRMSLQDFQNYMVFRAQNDQLKERFNTTNEIDFGFFGVTIVFDTYNRFFCMDRNLNKTVFEGSEIVSFSIKEDTALLFEGSAAGFRRYPSSVPDRAMAMMPQINQMITQRNLARTMESLNRSTNNNYNRSNPPPPPPHNRYIDFPEPFSKFYVEIKVKNPYFGALFAQLDGPRFNNDFPDVNNYITEYTNSAQVMEQLAMLLAEIAFPGTPLRDAGSSAAVNTAPVSSQPAAGSSAVVVADEIKKYKALLDQGLITEEEFSAKKRQLLGI